MVSYFPPDGTSHRGMSSEVCLHQLIWMTRTGSAALLTKWDRNNRKARIMNLGPECFAPDASPVCCAYQGGFPGVGPVGGNTRNKVEDTIGKIVDKAPTQVRGQLQGIFGKAKKLF